MDRTGTGMFGNEIEAERKIVIRREVVYVVLSGLFLGTLAALIDTILFYVGTRWLSRYLQIDPNSNFV